MRLFRLAVFPDVLCCLSGALPWRLAFSWALCASGGWHFEGLAGWACVVFGLFVGFWVAVGVAVVMCEWQLAHLGAARRMPRYGGVVRI